MGFKVSPCVLGAEQLTRSCGYPSPQLAQCAGCWTTHDVKPRRAAAQHPSHPPTRRTWSNSGITITPRCCAYLPHTLPTHQYSSLPRPRPRKRPRPRPSWRRCHWHTDALDKRRDGIRRVHASRAERARLAQQWVLGRHDGKRLIVRDVPVQDRQLGILHRIHDVIQEGRSHVVARRVWDVRHQHR